MDPRTEEHLATWWADLLGIEPEQLGRTVTVRDHARLEGWPGWFVVWRGAGVHVTVPDTATAEEVADLERSDAAVLRDPASWSAFAVRHGLRLIGPSEHAYLDRSLPPVDGVTAVRPPDLEGLRELVDPDEWEEAGFDDEPEHLFCLRRAGTVVAAANLTDWDGAPRDVGVLVAPQHRGRGLAALVGAHAASCAVERHGVARWTARTANAASLRTARRLGFEPWATQLAVRA